MFVAFTYLILYLDMSLAAFKSRGEGSVYAPCMYNLAVKRIFGQGSQSRAPGILDVCIRKRVVLLFLD